jgi:hypothetical protein
MEDSTFFTTPRAIFRILSADTLQRIKNAPDYLEDKNCRKQENEKDPGDQD